jgi:hypothetical protein
MGGLKRELGANLRGFLASLGMTMLFFV